MAEVYKRLSTIQYFEDVGDEPILEYVAFISISDFKPKTLATENAQISVCSDGKGTVRINGKNNNFYKDNIFLMNPCTVHGTGASDKERLEYYVLGLKNISFEITDAEIFPNANKESLLPVYAPIIFKEASNPTDKTKTILSNLFALCLIEAEKLTKVSFLPNSRPGASLLANGVAKYLDTHFNQQLTIEDIANVFFCSKSTVMHTFKKTYGVTIMNYLLQKRLEEVKSWLKISNMAISDIAINAGFSSMPFFYKYFQKNVGMTPVEYRRNCT